MFVFLPFFFLFEFCPLGKMIASSSQSITPLAPQVSASSSSSYSSSSSSSSSSIFFFFLVLLSSPSSSS
uniref:Wsv048 n=1 Tax=White spot syndrome virus TaxID=92652 RepID=A0A2U9GGV9_WSSV|nr:wsv048 [Shrimp white spot syndrome virus]